MKKSILCFLMTLVATLATYGMSFRGTITQTITNTNDPSFHAGQTVSGWYQYEADDADGVFAANFFGMGGSMGEAPALCGSIFSFVQHPLGGDGWLSLAGVTSRFAELTVEDNHVSDFHYFTDYGYSNLSFRLSDFGVSTHYLDRAADKWINYSTLGTICFSAPTVVSVPEGATTVGLAALSCVCVVLLRRRFMS